MMNPQSGTFEPPNEKAWRKAEERDMREKIEKPTICIGEIVEVKGVKFIVRYFKPNGKMGLRMVRQDTTITANGGSR